MNGRGGTAAAWLLALAGSLAVTACGRVARHPGDLERIRASGELRVIVRPGFFGSQDRAAAGGDQASMLRHLAARLGVRLRWIQARRNDQVLPWLAEDRGDLAVHRFSPVGLRAAGFLPTAAVDWVDDLLIANPGERIDSVDALGTRPVDVQRSTLRWCLAGEIGEGRMSPDIIPVPEEVPLEAIAGRVAGGRYRLSIVDSGVLDASARRYEVKVVGPLAETRALVWAVRRRSVRLKNAIDDFLFAEKVLSSKNASPACRTLADIRRVGVLRLVTRNSPTTCRVVRGGLAGFEYDLALSFARFLRVRLALSIPPPGTDVLRWLEEGYGDLAALHQPLPPNVERRFPLTLGYQRVDLVTVAGRTADPPATVADLGGRRVIADPLTARLAALLPIEPPVGLVSPDPGGDPLSTMIAVEKGAAGLGIVDSDTLELELSDRPTLRRGPTVLAGAWLRWVVTPSAPGLRMEADRFLREARRSGLVRQLRLTDLRHWERSVPPGRPAVPPGHLTPFDDLLIEAGRANGIDWRLLASLMYEESRFDPRAVGPGGSAGLFQLMPATWRELGVTDPMDPEQAIPAAGRYLRQLMDQFPGVAMADRAAMAIASYNVGPRHVADARRLAALMHLDPDRWVGNVETAMVLLDDPEVARRFPAGVCRCRRAVGYTRRILRRYRAYREQFSPLGSSGL